jgi:predicted aspartyl protease
MKAKINFENVEWFVSVTNSSSGDMKKIICIHWQHQMILFCRLIRIRCLEKITKNIIDIVSLKFEIVRRSF